MVGAWSIHGLCTYLVYLWSGAAIAMGTYVVLHTPILILFAASRISQLRGRGFELRADRPSHSALHWFVLLFDGAVLPAFYLLTVRTRSFLCLFSLGPDTNSGLTITLGAVIIAWVVAHLTEPALRLGAPRFDWGWTDRILSVAMLALCGWFHFAVLAANIEPTILAVGQSEAQLFSHWAVRIVLPQAAFLGSSLVAVFAVIEAWRTPRAVSSPRRRFSVALGAAVAATLFAPLWLSIPRTPASQARAVVAANREALTGYAALSGLDPRLLAGIVQVAQEERPRLTAPHFEPLGITLWWVALDDGLSGEFGDPLVNPRVGLCGLRPTQIVESLALLRDLPRGGHATMAKLNSPYGTPFYWWIMPWGRALPRYESQMRGLFQYALSDPGLLDRIKRVVDGTGLAAIPINSPGFSASEQLMASILCEPKDNLAATAAILLLLRDQWIAAGVDVDAHPEILASVLRDGYLASRPSPAFEPNAFGRRVAAWMRSDECAALFPLTPQEASHEQ